MMKKILSTILIIAMLIPTAVFAETESIEPVGYDANAEEIDLLIEAGYITAEKSEADYDKEMTAKEFRSLLLKLGITDEQLREIDAFGIDYTAKSNVTRTDAAVPLVKMLGYDVWAINQGGYPDGYISIADSNGYFDGVTARGDEALTRADAYKMVFNAINSPVYPDILYPGQNFINEEETYLTEKLSIYSIEGIVTSTHKNSLPNYTTSNDGIFTIGNVKIISNGKNIESYFATRVKAWCRYDEKEDEYTLLTVNYHKKNNSMKINAQDIINYNGYAYQYYDHEKGNLETERISALIKVVYNGIGINVSNSSIVKMKPANGSIILMDNDGDSKWDVLMINDYDIACVEEVRAQDNIIITKAIQAFAKRHLDFENIDIYDVNNNMVDISSISEWNILSLAKDGNGGYLYAVVSRNAVTGSVRSSNRDNVSLELEMKDGNNYYVANGFLPANAVVSNIFPQSEEFTFYLTADGVIAAFKKTLDASYHLAYLAEVKDYIDEDTDEPALRIKAFDFTTESGVTLYAAEKCRLEGTRTALNLIADAMKDNEGYALDILFRYKLNSKSEIIDIDLPSDNNMLYEPNPNGGLVRIADAPVVAHVTDNNGTPDDTSDDKQIPSQRRTAYHRESAFAIRDQSATNRGWIDALTVETEHKHLYVPADRTNLDGYYFAFDYVDNALVYEAYRIEGETILPNIVVELAGNGIPLRDTSGGVTNNTGLVTSRDMYLVKDVLHQWNDSTGEEEYILTLLGLKGEQEYKISSVELANLLNLKPGMIIRFSLNSNDEVNAAIVHVSEDNLQPGNDWYSWTPALNNPRGVFGLAYKVYGSAVAIALKNPNSGLAWNEMITINPEGLFRVYVYDVKKKTATEATLSDIDTYDSVGSAKASRIFYYSSSGSGRVMFIYNGLKN